MPEPRGEASTDYFLPTAAREEISRAQEVNSWRTGARNCTTPTRIELCKIADYDLKVALIEQVIEGLDQNDQTQAEAGAMLQAVVDAFPNAGWRRL